MRVYGLAGFTHHGARLLTLFSPAGAAALREAIGPGDGLLVVERDDGLIQCHEQRGGALERLVADLGVTVVDKAEWDAVKGDQPA